MSLINSSFSETPEKKKDVWLLGSFVAKLLSVLATPEQKKEIEKIITEEEPDLDSSGTPILQPSLKTMPSDKTL